MDRDVPKSKNLKTYKNKTKWRKMITEKYYSRLPTTQAPYIVPLMVLVDVGLSEGTTM